VLIKQNIEELPEFINLASELNIDNVVLLPLVLAKKNFSAYSLDNMKKRAREIILKAQKIANKKEMKIIAISGNKGCFNFNIKSRKIPQNTSYNCYDPW